MAIVAITDVAGRITYVNDKFCEISGYSREDGCITADPDLIRATVLNLLLNAAQAMNGQGRICVTGERRDGRCVIGVRDNGPGIPSELRHEVLEPFFTTKARGGGLGLPIAKRVAELHGGTLTLACPESGGTSVTVTLPVDPRELRDPA